MQFYTSKRPRVHISTPEKIIKASIREYCDYAARHNNELSKELAECVTDLLEELDIRRGQIDRTVKTRSRATR